MTWTIVRKTGITWKILKNTGDNWKILRNAEDNLENTQKSITDSYTAKFKENKSF